MEEYRIEIKVKNNLIVKKIENSGYKTVGEFCRLNNIMSQVSKLGDIINMKASPVRADGKWQLIILRCSDILGCAPEDLFTDSQLNTILKTNKKHIEMNEADMRFMLQHQDDRLLEDVVGDSQLNGLIVSAIGTLHGREKKVLELIYGLEDGVEHTLQQAAEIIGVTRERIRQIEAKALRKLRSPERNATLREFVSP